MVIGVSGPTKASNVGATKKTGKKNTDRAGAVASSSFAKQLQQTLDDGGEGDAPLSSLDSIIGGGAVQGLLSLQEVDGVAARQDNLQKHREHLAKEWGKGAISKLDELHKYLLSGEVPQHKLEELARHATMRRKDVTDPYLLSLLEDIELRALVELEKLKKK
jgi:hypothetical protein